MKLRPPPAVVSRLAPPLVRLLARTWRVERHHHERYLETVGPRIIFLWHETLLPLLLLHRDQGVTVVVSRARDGRYLSGAARRLGYHAIEGSSRRGQVPAMRGLLEALTAGRTVAVTPDGPVGPRRELKRGPVEAAQRAGARIQVATAVARRAWRLRSWDRFMVPKPGSTVRLAYSTPRVVDPGPEGIAAALDWLRHTFTELEEETGWPDAVVPTD